jgi:hypothetical protein
MTILPESGARHAANPPQPARIWRDMPWTLTRRGRSAACLIAALASAPALAAEGWFTTASGHRVETPAIETLDCPRMETVLAGIDASGYRKGKHKPYDKADMRLFDYEDRLAQAHFDRCGRADTPPAPTADEAEGGVMRGVFERGYD